MNNIGTGTIVLSGQDSINFAYSLFRPTQEEIEENRRHIDYINSNITVTQLDDGFMAEIADLDLSFLDETTEERTLTIRDTFCLNVQTESYSDADEHKYPSIKIQRDDHYRDSKNNILLVLAA